MEVIKIVKSIQFSKEPGATLISETNERWNEEISDNGSKFKICDVIHLYFFVGFKKVENYWFEKLSDVRHVSSI